MAFEIAAEMRQIGKTADFRGLSDGKCLICQKIFRLVEPYFNQIAVRGAAEKLFIIRIKLAFSILAIWQSFSVVQPFS